MPAPWIEVWKAWLARVAERFVQSEGPAADAKAQRVQPLRSAGATQKSSISPRRGPTHRSGQRHG